MTPSYLSYAASNPYGIELLNSSTRASGARIFEDCKSAVLECRRMARQHDSPGFGNDTETNRACVAAGESCREIQNLYRLSNRFVLPSLPTHWLIQYNRGRCPYDITQSSCSTFPGEYHREYLNNATVLGAIGALTNYTQSNIRVLYNFRDSACSPLSRPHRWLIDMAAGDSVRGGQLEAIDYLLQNNVRVALVYGKSLLVP